MGDPKRLKKKYQKPSHPWQEARIAKENELMRSYALKNKAELWKAASIARAAAAQAKALIAKPGAQTAKEIEALLARLRKLGLLGESAVIDDVLVLDTEDVLKRRLATLVWKKGLARSATQARQFIVHGHISIAGRVTTAPSYLVPVDQENAIAFVSSSSLASESHPERIPVGGA